MKIIHSARQAGKTTKVVKYALEHGYSILAINQSEKRRLLTQYPELDRNQVYTWEERSKQYSRKPIGTIIDNVDILLAGMLHDPIKMLTITDYSDPTPEHKVRSKR